MSGVITGGWGFVIAAYAITAIVFAGYTIVLGMRLKSARREDIHE
jgi:hypothetical protein